MRKKITRVDTCRDCNGTGADYDKNCRPVACRACGGSGMVELEGWHSPQPTDTKQDREA